MKKSEINVVKDSRDGLYDVKIVSKLPQESLKSETIINCQLVIPDTNYTRKRETVYYGNFIIIWCECVWCTEFSLFNLIRTNAHIGWNWGRRRWLGAFVGVGTFIKPGW